MHIYRPQRLIITLFFCFFLLLGYAQKTELSTDKKAKIATMIQKYKADVRGPYLDLRWFCNDGTFNAPREPCPANVGGVQRARYKPEVIALAQSDHIFLGQILATTDKTAFWDATYNHSRLKQYQIEKWLKSIDEGWINRKAQFYRGAVQAEDEEAWGVEFFKFVLAKDQNLIQSFYLLREAAKDLPHRGDDNTAQLMRSQSKAISDVYEPFMDLRVKIHGQPEYSDIQKVRKFQRDKAAQLTPALLQKLDQLALTMEQFFQPVNLKAFSQLVRAVGNPQLKEQINTFIQAAPQLIGQQKLEVTADLMWNIRENITIESGAQGRLALLDISLQLERFFLQESQKFKPVTLGDLMNIIAATSKATAASGYLEIWEWQQLQNTFSNLGEPELTVSQLGDFVVAARSLLEWGTGMTKAVYEPTLKVFEGFEPLAHGFIDDRIRGSVALPLGNAVGVLGTFLAGLSAGGAGGQRPPACQRGTIGGKTIVLAFGRGRRADAGQIDD